MNVICVNLYLLINFILHPFLIIIMILKKILTPKNILRICKFPFSQNPKISTQKIQVIKNHSLTTQYDGLNPTIIEHKSNNWRIIQDETKMRFLIEQGGFSGCSDIGILLKIGTQHQTQKNAGSLNCLKNLVHMKPQFEDSVKNYQFLNQTGCTVDFNYDVESTYLKCSFFEEDMEIMTNLLLDLALRQKKLFDENFQTDGQILDINEIVRITAFGGRGIGMSSNGMGQVLTNQSFLNFQRQFFTPHETVISLSNVSQPEKIIKSIKDKIIQRYPEFLKRRAPQKPISNYTGGTARVSNEDSQFFSFAVAFPGTNYKGNKMELYNILRILLGNASSFSSGGPGKGMHSRCTKNMLNKEHCIDSASYILGHFEHFGLFGLTASGVEEQASEVINITLRQLALLRNPINEIELQRAKNILIAGIYANIQRQSDRLEELTKHLNYYGRIKINQFQRNIRAVKAQQIRQQIQKIFRMPPTFVLQGGQKSIHLGNERQWISKLLKKY